MTAAAVLLTGCASSKEADGGAASTSSGKPVSIKLHTWNNLKTDGFDVVLQEFEKKYPNIKVEFVSAGDNNSLEALKKIDLAAASAEDMDVIMLPASNYLAQRAALGMFEPLDSYLSKEGIKLDDEYIGATQLNGKTYGIPGKSVSQFVVINEAHMKEAGLTVPQSWTWDEYLDYSKKMTKTEGGKTRYGTYFHTFINFTYLAQFAQMQNAGLVTDDGKSANINTPFMRKSLELRLQAEKDKSGTPYAEVISQKLNYRPQYFNQNTSMMQVGSFIIAETGGSDAVPATFKTVFAPMPTMKKGDPILTPVGGDNFAIYNNSKHKQEAYTFIRWFTTEGLVLQGRFIPSWKKANLEQVVNQIVSKTKTPEMVDKESLLYVLKNSAATKTAVPLTYQAEVDKVMQEEFDNMMLKNQDIDTTLKVAQDKIQKLVDSKNK
ncbi:extracellular solute-binding protein [Paenibacillus aceris]|nr:extracellular solute-binding protein [Paenibacillus aceris]